MPTQSASSEAKSDSREPNSNITEFVRKSIAEYGITLKDFIDGKNPELWERGKEILKKTETT